MKIAHSLIFSLFHLIVLSACATREVSTAKPSNLPVAATTSFAPTATSTASPSPTAALVESTASVTFTSAAKIFDLVIDNLAIGLPGQVFASGFSSTGNDYRQFARWDGTHWIALGTGYPTAGNGLTADSTGHLYTEILTPSELGMTTAIIGWNGEKWEDITGNFIAVVDGLAAGRISSNIPVAVLVVDGKGDLYAAGTFYYPSADHTNELPMGFVARWDRENWSILSQGFDGLYITDMAVSAAGEVYVAGEQQITGGENSSFIAKWDGETWTQLDTRKFNATQRIALDRTGRLFVYDPSNVIAYWEGSDWTFIADQLRGEAPAVYDMTVDENGQFCIGGSFETVNAVSASNIACWDGETWFALEEGVNERVNALAFDQNGDLYAVGFFTEAGGIIVDHAARWDGFIWQPLGQ